MVVSRLTSCARPLVITSVIALLAACSASDTDPAASGNGTGDPIVGLIPGEPGWQPRTPPAEGLCVGVNPGEEAFELSRTIAAAAARALAREEALADARAAQGDAESDAESDADTAATSAPDDATAEGDVASGDAAVDDNDTTPSGDASDDGGRDTAAAEEPSPEPQTEPCTPDYLDVESCIGYEAPSFAAYDFQPQSCGFGATYGLEAFKGRVTFVALFASW